MSFKSDIDPILRIHADLDEDLEIIPAIRTLIGQYSDEEAFKFASTSPGAEYLVTLFVKAGMRDFDINWLVDRLDGDNEDRVFEAAVALAILNDNRGLEELIKFAHGWGPWEKSNIARIDIIDELKYFPVEYALRLKREIEEGAQGD